MKLAKHHAIKEGSLAPVSRTVMPFWPLQRLHHQIDRLLEDPFGGWLSPAEPLFESWVPAVSLYEEKNNVIVKAELPGMKKEEIEVYMTGDNLNIAGERKSEKEEKTAESYRSERYFGRFHRSIPLATPVKAEKIEAHYKDGILTVICPKTETARRKDVAIKID